MSVVTIPDVLKAMVEDNDDNNDCIHRDDIRKLQADMNIPNSSAFFHTKTSPKSRSEVCNKQFPRMCRLRSV